MKRKKLTSGQLSMLCMELALMLDAGLGAGEGLRQMSGDSGGDPALDQMAGQVEGGAPLSQAMWESGIFPDYVCALVACGERTGRTEEALRSLADHYDSRLRMEETLTGALLHPVLMLLLMLAVMVLLLTRVLPVFDDVYASLGGRLGGMAAGLLTLGRGLDRWMPLLAGLLAAALASLAALSLSEGLRQRLLALWIRRDRGLAAETATARIAQALAMGLASGLPMEEALDLAARLQGENRKAAERCRKCREQIETGAGLTESLREAGVLPADCCRLLAAGVRAGAADTVMDRLARRLAENSENHLSAAVARVEPLLVLVSALLVGGVILSVMLPLMDILSALG